MLRYLNPLAWMRWFGEFFYLWFVSAPWRDAPKTLPFLGLLAFLVVAGALSLSSASQWRSSLLDNQLRKAFERDDYATAELVLQRKLSARSDDAKLLHQLALTRDAQGNHDEAVSLMRDIVYTKDFSPSVEWLLKDQYIGKTWANLDDVQKKEFGKLLATLSAERPKDLNVKQLYADYLIASDRSKDAVLLLEELMPVQPMRGLQAAAIARRNGNFSQANSLAEKTLQLVEKLMSEDPTNSGIVLAVAQNQVFLKKYQDAVRTLNLGVQRAKANRDKVKLNQAMGDAMVAWVNSLDETPQTTSKQRLRVLQMLEAALRYAPNNPRVLTMVADKVLATANEDDEEIEAIRQALVSGTSPGISHFLKGTAALMNDDTEKATRHLKIAAELMPRSAAILNNLAVAMTLRPDGDMDQALKLSNSAIEQAHRPTPHFYETRGQILLRMKKFESAIPDLERALQVVSLAPNAHRALAECYKSLGEDGIAEAHLDSAEQLEQEAEAKKQAAAKPAA